MCNELRQENPSVVRSRRGTYNPGMRRLLALLLSTFAIAGCDEEPAEREAAASETTETRAAPGGSTAAAEPAAPSSPSRSSRAGGIAWEAPEPFRAVQPTSQMRAAEYVFPEQEGEEPASLTVFFFGPGQGGSIQENIDRWVNQFQQPDGRASSEAAEISERDVNDLKVHLVDVSGTYSAMTPMGSRGGPATDQRMLAAIVEGPEGPVFFKMVGPRAVMERAEQPFEGLVASFHAP